MKKTFNFINNSFFGALTAFIFVTIVVASLFHFLFEFSGANSIPEWISAIGTVGAVFVSLNIANRKKPDHFIPSISSQITDGNAHFSLDLANLGEDTVIKVLDSKLFVDEDNCIDHFPVKFYSHRSKTLMLKSNALVVITAQDIPVFWFNGARSWTLQTDILVMPQKKNIHVECFITGIGKANGETNVSEEISEYSIQDQIKYE
jgi:hypothetical protein